MNSPQRMCNLIGYDISNCERKPLRFEPKAIGPERTAYVDSGLVQTICRYRAHLYWNYS